jgi:hypothetical protein
MDPDSCSWSVAVARLLNIYWDLTRVKIRASGRNTTTGQPMLLRFEKDEYVTYDSSEQTLVLLSVKNSIVEKFWNHDFPLTK